MMKLQSKAGLKLGQSTVILLPCLYLSLIVLILWLYESVGA